MEATDKQQVVAFVEAPTEASSALLDSFRSSVNIRVKQPAVYDVDVDFDKLSFEHMALLDRMRGQDTTPEEQTQAIKEILLIVTGQDVSKLPLRVTAAILQELGKMTGEASRPNA